jgi:hypothetical protein
VRRKTRDEGRDAGCEHHDIGIQPSRHRDPDITTLLIWSPRPYVPITISRCHTLTSDGMHHVIKFSMPDITTQCPDLVRSISRFQVHPIPTSGPSSPDVGFASHDVLSRKVGTRDILMRYPDFRSRPRASESRPRDLRDKMSYLRDHDIATLRSRDAVTRVTNAEQNFIASSIQFA